MMTLVDHGTFVPKKPTAHGEQQDYPPCGHHTPSAAPSLWSLDHACSTPTSQPGGRSMPPDGPHIPTYTGFDFEPDDENEPPYSRAFSRDEEQDGGHITYPPVDADLDSEDTLDVDGSLMDEHLRHSIIQPFQPSTSDRLSQAWKEVE